jgi:integrase
MPCSVRLLKTTPGSFDFYDFDEYRQLVTTAAKIDVTTSLIVLLGGDAGLRAGEMRALRWIDADIDKSFGLSGTNGTATLRPRRVDACDTCR